jgi:hypothetical protein
MEIRVQTLKQLLNLLDHGQVVQRLDSQVCAVGHVVNAHQVRGCLINQLLGYTIRPALKDRGSVSPKQYHLLSDLGIVKSTMIPQGTQDHLFRIVCIPTFCHTPKKQQMRITSFSRGTIISMDAQPLLVVNCCDLVTRYGDVVSLCECLLDLVTDHVRKSMRDLPPCRLRPMLARLMRHIQSIVQVLAGSVVTHGAAQREQMEHGAELHHFLLTLLCQPNSDLVQNTLTSSCIVDALVLDVLVMSKVLVLSLLHLHRITERFTTPSMLPQRVDLGHQQLLPAFNE